MYIDPNNYFDSMKLLLRSVRKGWKQDDIKKKVFTDGITNVIVGCYVGDVFTQSEVVLFKLYGVGSEKLIDRVSEVENMRMLHSFGCGPQVYAEFDNGLCYEFFHGTVGDEDMIRHPQYSRLIAKEIARLHSLDINNYKKSTSREPCLFRKIREWAVNATEPFSDSAKQKVYDAAMPSRAELFKEITDLENVLTKHNCDVVFSHNDILIKNLVLNRAKDRIHLIDIEYADWNYAPFDIANHFCEFAGIEVVDHSRYPDAAFQRAWIGHYLAWRREFSATGREGEGGGGLPPNDGDSPDPAAVDRLYRLVTAFSLAAHMFWAMWAFTQAHVSQLDFDFTEYGISRYQEFTKRKEERLHA